MINTGVISLYYISTQELQNVIVICYVRIVDITLTYSTMIVVRFFLCYSEIHFTCVRLALVIASHVLEKTLNNTQINNNDNCFTTLEV